MELKLIQLYIDLNVTSKEKYMRLLCSLSYLEKEACVRNVSVRILVVNNNFICIHVRLDYQNYMK